MRNWKLNLIAIVAVVALLVAILPAPVFATALTANRNTPARIFGRINLTVKDAEVIYAGSMVSVDSNGEAVSATDSATDQVIGRAAEEVDNTDDGETINVDVGVYRWVNGDTITDAHIGDYAYVSDDQTVVKTDPGNTCIAGVIVDVDDDGVWVTHLYSTVNSGAGAFTTISASGAVTLGSTLAVTGAIVGSSTLDVDSVTVDAGAGLDTQAAGALAIGAATATSLNLGASDIETTALGTFTAGRVTPVTDATVARVITSADYGNMVMCTYTGVVAVTLPANGAAAGSWVEIVGAAAVDTQIITISAATADTLVGPNDIDLDSVTWGTGHRIGAHARFTSNGSFWQVQNLGGTTMTYTD